MLLGLLVVVLLVAANGFFVATEFALVSSRSTRIDQLAQNGNRAARMVQRAKENPTLFISATQLGVTMASLILGWLGEQTFAEILQPILERVFALFAEVVPGEIAGGPAVTAHALASVLAIVGITFLHITLGEQVPKILALQRAETIIMFAVQPLSVWAWIFRPFIALLYGFTNLVLRLIGVEFRGDEHAVHSPEELLLLVTRSARAGLLTAPERELVQRAFAFSDQTAGEVMLPRTEIVALPAESSIDEAVKLALRHRHSRVPVYEQTIDNVVGVLSTKDLLGVVARRGAAATPADHRASADASPLVAPGRDLANPSRDEATASRWRSSGRIRVGPRRRDPIRDLVTLVGSVGDEYTAATLRSNAGRRHGGRRWPGARGRRQRRVEYALRYSGSIRSAAWCSRAWPASADRRRGGNRQCLAGARRGDSMAAHRPRAAAAAQPGRGRRRCLRRSRRRRRRLNSALVCDRASAGATRERTLDPTASQHRLTLDGAERAVSAVTCSPPSKRARS